MCRIHHNGQGSVLLWTGSSLRLICSLGDQSAALQIGHCGQPVTLPVVQTAVQYMGFENLEEFGAVGVMIGGEGFTPLAGMAAEIARDIAETSGGLP